MVNAFGVSIIETIAGFPAPLEVRLCEVLPRQLYNAVLMPELSDEIHPFEVHLGGPGIRGKQCVNARERLVQQRDQAVFQCNTGRLSALIQPCLHFQHLQRFVFRSILPQI